MPWFGASKMISTGSRVAQSEHKESLTANVNPLCHAAFLWLVRVQAQRNTKVRYVTAVGASGTCGAREYCYGGHPYRMRPNLRLCVTLFNSELRISIINFYLRLRHTRRGPESESPYFCTRSHIPRLSPSSSTPTSHTGALQLEYRTPHNLRCSRKR